MVRNLTKSDATMQERFTLPRAAIELNSVIGVQVHNRTPAIAGTEFKFCRADMNQLGHPRLSVQASNAPFKTQLTNSEVEMKSHRIVTVALLGSLIATGVPVSAHASIPDQICSSIRS
jgi:hypothetical protein